MGRWQDAQSSQGPTPSSTSGRWIGAGAPGKIEAPTAPASTPSRPGLFSSLYQGAKNLQNTLVYKPATAIANAAKKPLQPVYDSLNTAAHMLVVDPLDKAGELGKVAYGAAKTIFDKNDPLHKYYQMPSQADFYRAALGMVAPAADSLYGTAASVVPTTDLGSSPTGLVRSPLTGKQVPTATGLFKQARARGESNAGAATETAITTAWNLITLYGAVKGSAQAAKDTAVFRSKSGTTVTYKDLQDITSATDPSKLNQAKLEAVKSINSTPAYKQLDSQIKAQAMKQGITVNTSTPRSWAHLFVEGQAPATQTFNAGGQTFNVGQNVAAPLGLNAAPPTQSSMVPQPTEAPKPSEIQKVSPQATPATPPRESTLQPTVGTAVSPATVPQAPGQMPPQAPVQVAPPGPVVPARTSVLPSTPAAPLASPTLPTPASLPAAPVHPIDQAIAHTDNSVIPPGGEKNYFVYNPQTSNFTPIVAKPLQLFPGLDLFVHPALDGSGYAVTEGKTGTSIAFGKNPKEAQANAVTTLAPKLDKIPGFLDTQIANHGLSPRYIPKTSLPAPEPTSVANELVKMGIKPEVAATAKEIPKVSVTKYRKPLATTADEVSAQVKEVAKKKDVQPITKAAQVGKPEPAKPVVDRKIDFKFQPTTKAQHAVANRMVQIDRELENAQAGQRIRTSDGSIKSIPSSFPSWIPDGLRLKPLVESVRRQIIQGKVPTSPREVALYNAVADQIYGPTETSVVPDESIPFRTSGPSDIVPDTIVQVAHPNGKTSVFRIRKDDFKTVVNLIDGTAHGIAGLDQKNGDVWHITAKSAETLLRRPRFIDKGIINPESIPMQRVEGGKGETASNVSLKPRTASAHEETRSALVDDAISLRKQGIIKDQKSLDAIVSDINRLNPKLLEKVQSIAATRNAFLKAKGLKLANSRTIALYNPRTSTIHISDRATPSILVHELMHPAYHTLSLDERAIVKSEWNALKTSDKAFALGGKKNLDYYTQLYKGNEDAMASEYLSWQSEQWRNGEPVSGDGRLVSIIKKLWQSIMNFLKRRPEVSPEFKDIFQKVFDRNSALNGEGVAEHVSALVKDGGNANEFKVGEHFRKEISRDELPVPPAPRDPFSYDHELEREVHDFGYAEHRHNIEVVEKLTLKDNQYVRTMDVVSGGGVLRAMQRRAAKGLPTPDKLWVDFYPQERLVIDSPKGEAVSMVDLEKANFSEKERSGVGEIDKQVADLVAEFDKNPDGVEHAVSAVFSKAAKGLREAPRSPMAIGRFIKAVNSETLGKWIQSPHFRHAEYFPNVYRGVLNQMSFNHQYASRVQALFKEYNINTTRGRYVALYRNGMLPAEKMPAKLLEFSEAYGKLFDELHGIAVSKELLKPEQYRKNYTYNSVTRTYQDRFGRKINIERDPAFVKNREGNYINTDLYDQSLRYVKELSEKAFLEPKLKETQVKIYERHLAESFNAQTPLTVPELSRHLDIRESEVRKVMEELEIKGSVHSEKVGENREFYLNPETIQKYAGGKPLAGRYQELQQWLQYVRSPYRLTGPAWWQQTKSAWTAVSSMFTQTLASADLGARSAAKNLGWGQAMITKEGGYHAYFKAVQKLRSPEARALFETYNSDALAGAVPELYGTIGVDLEGARLLYSKLQSKLPVMVIQKEVELRNRQIAFLAHWYKGESLGLSPDVSQNSESDLAMYAHLGVVRSQQISLPIDIPPIYRSQLVRPVAQFAMSAIKQANEVFHTMGQLSDPALRGGAGKQLGRYLISMLVTFGLLHYIADKILARKGVTASGKEYTSGGIDIFEGVDPLDIRKTLQVAGPAYTSTEGSVAWKAFAAAGNVLGAQLDRLTGPSAKILAHFFGIRLTSDQVYNQWSTGPEILGKETTGGYAGSSQLVPQRSLVQDALGYAQKMGWMAYDKKSTITTSLGAAKLLQDAQEKGDTKTYDRLYTKYRPYVEVAGDAQEAQSNLDSLSQMASEQRKTVRESGADPKTINAALKNIKENVAVYQAQIVRDFNIKLKAAIKTQP